MATKAVPLKNLGKIIDELFTIQSKIESKTKASEAKLALELEPLEARKKELENFVIENFTAVEIEGASGTIATAEKKVSPVPSVSDWGLLYQYITKTKSFDLLERRVSVKAWRERMDAKKVVPGVGTFNKISLKVSAKKK